MNRRLGIFFVLLAILLSLSCTAGCTSVRTADTHNTTVAVQSYNAWVSGQKEFDREMRSTLATIGDHVDTYNREIAKDQPDYSLLRENLARDRQLLDQWGSGIEYLTVATDHFEQSTTTLRYDNASSPRVKESLSLMTQYMKVYSIHVSNARQHLIEYVNNAEVYIGPDDPDYWNEQYRLDTTKAKDQASASFAEGDAALRNITAYAKTVEQLQ
jgi:hypothetical protein